MMYIDTNTTSEVWHVGKQNPIVGPPLLVTCVQADCDELDYLLNRFPDLPRVQDARVVRFYGDMAKFIVGNLT